MNQVADPTTNDLLPVGKTTDVGVDSGVGDICHCGLVMPVSECMGKRLPLAQAAPHEPQLHRCSRDESNGDPRTGIG